MTTNFAPVFQAAAKSWNVDPALLQSVAQVESGTNPNTPDSSAGAQGIMQVMPATGASLGVTDPSDPVQNIYAGAKYLSQMLDRYKSPDLAVAAYNAGPGRVDAYLNGTAALPTETLNYVPKVASSFKQLSAANTNAPASPQSYQVAAADLGYASDVMPSPGAPPSGVDHFARAMQAATSAPASPSTSAGNAAQSDPFSAAMAIANAAPAAPQGGGGAAQPVSGGAPGAPTGNTQPAKMSPGILSSLFAGTMRGLKDIPDTIVQGASYVDSKVPFLAALDNATVLSPSDETQLQADRDTYQAQYGNNPLAQAGRLVGNVAATAPIGGLAGAGLRSAAAAGADAIGAGTLAGRAITAGGNMLTGGGANVGARLAASVPTGALYGAGNALLTAAASDQPVVDQVMQGAKAGAEFGPAALVAGSGAKVLGKVATNTGNTLLDAYAPRAAAAVAQAAPAAAQPVIAATGNDLLDQMFAEHQAETEGRPYVPPTSPTTAPAAPQAALPTQTPAAAPTAFQTVAPRPLQPGEAGYDPAAATQAMTNLSPEDQARFAAGLGPAAPTAQAPTGNALTAAAAPPPAASGNALTAAGERGPVPQGAVPAPTATPAQAINPLLAAVPPAPPSATAPADAAQSAGQATTNPLLGAAPAPAQAIPTVIPKAGFVPPITQASADARADEIIQHFAKGGSLDVDATPLIPGSTPTLAQSIVGGNAGLATLERTVQAQAPQAFDTLAQAANTGRSGVLGRLIGTPADIQAAEAMRDSMTSDARNAAFANPQPVDAAPIADQLRGLIAANEGRPTVQAPLQRVLDQVNAIAPVADDGVTMPADPTKLYNVRKYLGDMVKPAAAGTADSGHAAAAQLLQLKPTMDDTIEAGAPGFKNYMQQFEQLSRPIDGMRYLQSLNLTDASGHTTLQKLDTAVKSLARNQAKNGVQLADSITPDQAGVLTALRDDMRRQALSGQGKGIGSDTHQKFATNALLGAMGGTDKMTAGAAAAGALGGVFVDPVTGGLALLGAGTRYALGAAAHRGEAMVRQALIDRLTNPALGVQSLAPLRAAAGGP